MRSSLTDRLNALHSQPQCTVHPSTQATNNNKTTTASAQHKKATPAHTRSCPPSQTTVARFVQLHTLVYTTTRTNPATMRSAILATLLTASLASAAVHKRQEPSTPVPEDTAAPTPIATAPEDTMMPTPTDMDTAMPTATDDGDADADSDGDSWGDHAVVVEQDPDCTTETDAAPADATAAPAAGSWSGSNWTDAGSAGPGSASVAPAAGGEGGDSGAGAGSGSGWTDAGSAQPVAPYMGAAAELRAKGTAAVVGLGALMAGFVALS